MSQDIPADEFPRIHKQIKQRLREQMEADRDKEGNEEQPQFRYAIDGTGNDYPLGSPQVVVFSDEDGSAMEIYEFPVIESEKKVLTAIGDGYELLMRDKPTPEIIAAYVDWHIGDVIGRSGDCFVLFFNTRLNYWHLAEGRVLSARYDTARQGYWGRERPS